MSADRLCIDLCCGRKGFSRAFSEAGWEVVTVDIDPKFEPTMCVDVTLINASDIWMHTNKGGFYKKVVVLAAPPCERFSFAPRDWPMKGIRKGLEIVGACLEIIADIKPDFWLMENPNGYLEGILSKPKMKIRQKDYGSPYEKITSLWGNIDLPLVAGERDATALVSNPSKKRANYATRLPVASRNSAKRAEMPLGLSQAILTAIEPQTQKMEG